MPFKTDFGRGTENKQKKSKLGHPNSTVSSTVHQYSTLVQYNSPTQQYRTGVDVDVVSNYGSGGPLFQHTLFHTTKYNNKIY